MFTTLLSIWAVLATIVLGLAIMRKFASRNEDDFLHVDRVDVTVRQAALAHTLNVLDRWGILLTTLVVVYGVGLLGWFLYTSWQETQQVVLK